MARRGLRLGARDFGAGGLAVVPTAEDEVAEGEPRKERRDS